MKDNKLISFLSMFVVILVVAALIYMFYLQNEKIEALNNDLMQKDQTISQLENENQSLIQEIGDNEAQIAELESNVSSLQSELDSLDLNNDARDYVKRLMDKFFDEYFNKTDSTESFMDLTDNELNAYNSFKESYNDMALTGLSPLSIMKLYLHAEKIKDYDTQYELYTRDEDQVMWTKEEHLNIPESDRVKDFGIFEKATRRTVTINEGEAIVSWYSTHDSDEYNEDAWQYGFRLTMDDNGIWRVGFLPMQ
ncbi:MAG TPA: hypothetical protein DDX29_07490 [Clostridiales bacterium]|nr:hypothetical protein [Clostridiales bacterium]